MITKMHCRAAGIATTLALLLVSTSALAEWRIDVESKVVSPGETGVTVDVTGYWDLPITALTVPIIVREIDPGAFWTGHLPSDTTLTGGTPFGVEWKWENPSWPAIVQQVKPAFVPLDPRDYCCPNVDPCIDALYDGVSPDQFVIQAQGIMAQEPAHSSGHVFVTLTFDVTGSGGDFEFDTACMSQNASDIFIFGSDYVDHGPTGSLGDFDGSNKGIITIQGDNEAPVWNPIPPKEVNEGENLVFDVSASDPDGNPLTLTAEEIPTNATFTDNGDDTGTFDWTPSYLQADVYDVRFIASDGTLADTEMVEITVNDVGEPAIISVVPDDARQGDFLTVHITGDKTSFGQASITTIVELRQGSSTIINGTSVVVINYTELDVDFSIPMAAPTGFYDVAIEEQFLPSVVMLDGFTVLLYCDCGPLWGDLNDEGLINPVDVVYLINKVYILNDMLPELPDCPRDAGDVNCDGIINPVDVVYYVNRVYLLNDMFCADPCGE